MKITTGHAITANMKAYADAVKVCGEYSIANPTCSIKDNPHSKPIDKAHRKALGSVQVLMICAPCGRVTPHITDDLRTECCGQATVQLNDHRRTRKAVSPPQV